MRHSLFKTLLLGGGVAILPLSAFADGATSSAATGGLGEITVTARKASENLQSTPVAVTAITTQALQTRQVTQAADIQNVAPGLSFAGAGTGPTAILTFAIRGNAENSPNSASDSPVGIYVDGVYQGRAIASNLGVLDLDSIEVLRGTQGTLFGRNTTGGAVQFTTVQPSGQFRGYLTGGLGDHAEHLVEGAATLPIAGDELSMRLAARYTDHGGYGYDPITNTPAGDLKSDISTRATVRWAPKNLPVKLTVSGDFVKSSDSGTMSTLVGVNPVGPLGTFYPGIYSPTYLSTPANFYQTFGNGGSGDPASFKPFNNDKAGGVLGNLVVDLGQVKLRSITAWRAADTANAIDLDSTPADVISFQSTYKQHQFSQELQLSGKAAKLDWIVGAYYFREGGTEQSDSYALQNAELAPGFFANLAPSARNFADFTSTSKALFGQVNYHLTDRLRVTGGFRYTWDNRDIIRHNIVNITSAPEVYFTFPGGVPTPNVVPPGTCSVAPPGAPCNDPHYASFSYPAWVFSVDYQVTDTAFVYAKTGAAALAGGFNTRPTPPGFDSFSPEKVKDVELGIKDEFLDHHLRTNLALYYNWENGVQNIVNSFTNGTLSQYVENAGNVRAYGFEFEGALIPWQGMQITTAVSNLHTHYVAGSYVEPGVGGPVDNSGQTVAQAPKWTFNVGATQKIPLSFGSLSLHADYDYISSRAFGQTTADLTAPGLTAAQAAGIVSANTISNALQTLHGYGLVNLRVSLNLNHPDGVELAFWVRNLTGTQYAENTFGSYNALGFVTQNPGAPRTLGGTITYKW